MNKAALFLCNRTLVMPQPWADAGIECRVVDTWAGHVRSGSNIRRISRDVRDWTPPPLNWVFACAFPPCTDLAVSGARWFRSKGLASLIAALQVVESCRVILESLDCPWFLENPVSTISTYWRKPDHIFDPCDYGDPYTKKTCLWTGGGFVMPAKRRVEPTLGSKMHLLSPSNERASLRSETPPGFAKAVFAANYPPCQRRLNFRKAAT